MGSQPGVPRKCCLGPINLVAGSQQSGGRETEAVRPVRRLLE